MIVAIYAYNENGKVYISTTLPPNLSALPTFDLYVSIPCPYVFVDELMFSLQNNPNQDYVYRLLIDVPLEVIGSFPIENGKVVASVWLYPEESGSLSFSFTPVESNSVNTVVAIDPPQPIDVKKLKDFSDIYSNSVKKLGTVNKILAIKVIIRIAVG